MRILGTIFAVMLAPVALSEPVGGQQLRFQAGVSRVTLAVVVRDSRGRPVKGLSAGDFDVRDQGVSRAITDFRNESSAVSVAILTDTSGSMRVGPKLDRLNEFAEYFFRALQQDKDEAALFAFERDVHVVHDFTSRLGLLRQAFASLKPFGSTSLFDAIANTAQRVEKRPGRHAVIVLTDGVDTSSRLTEPEVSGIASAIEVPVYVVAVGLPIDLSAESLAQTGVGNLEDLSRRTGGMFYTATDVIQASLAAFDIVDDLRHQYLIGLEPSDVPGWHRLEVRVRRRVTIQARGGYWVGDPSVLR
jgi:VWFA-related protein